MKTQGYANPTSMHVLTEAMRQAYADRAYFLGDPAFVKVPLEFLLSKKYARRIRDEIPNQKARTSKHMRHGQAPPNEGPSTTHLSVVDGEGNVVSTTQNH